MDTTTRLLLPEVTAALQQNPEELRALTEELHPADLADLAAALEPLLAQTLIRILPVEDAARILEELDEDRRAQLFEAVATTNQEVAVSLTDEMAADERADLYATLPEELRSQLLDAIDDEQSRDIRQLLSYPEGSAGALLTTEFVALPATATVSEAIELVRKVAAEMETIYTAYAVDRHGTLLGAVSLRDLVVSPAAQTVDAIMNPNIVSVDVDADQEEAAKLMAKYDLLVLPVVDRSHRIVGIITVDDVMDVVEEEATEDAQKMGAVEPLEAPYMSTPLLNLIKARAPWLVALFFTSLAAEAVLQSYSGAGLQEFLLLLLFVPVVMASGGNSGSQSATLIIRAMAVDRLQGRDAWLVLKRELVVGSALGAILGAVAMARVLTSRSLAALDVALAIGLAVVLVVVVGALIGSGVPLLLRRLRIDPAVSSTPFIASVLDITGLVLYFEIARLLLG